MNTLLSLSDHLLSYAASNLIVALPIAMLAWYVQTKRDLPFLAHLLWLIVLLKILTPPFVPIPVVSPVVPDPYAGPVPFATEPSGMPTALFYWRAAAVVLWILGSASIFAWSSYCILRFNRLLRLSSAPAGQELERATRETARRLGLENAPAIRTTSANVPPMVWWLGGRVRIYVPAALEARLDSASLRLVVAHELGHVGRRDHLIRCLEWLACVCFWWNPLAWWARRNLRINEEICCDALVVSKLGPCAESYASSLVSVLEILTTPALRPPAMASEINGGQFMERRIRMLISEKPMASMSRTLRTAVVLCAAAVLPLGLSVAQDAGNFDKVETWLEAGVNSAYLTAEQAEVMMRALRSDHARSGAQEAELTMEVITQELEAQFERGQLTEQQVRDRLERKRQELLLQQTRAQREISESPNDR